MKTISEGNFRIYDESFFVYMKNVESETPYNKRRGLNIGEISVYNGQAYFFPSNRICLATFSEEDFISLNMILQRANQKLTWKKSR